MHLSNSYFCAVERKQTSAPLRVNELASVSVIACGGSPPQCTICFPLVIFISNSSLQPREHFINTPLHCAVLSYSITFAPQYGHFTHFLSIGGMESFFTSHLLRKQHRCPHRPAQTAEHRSAAYALCVSARLHSLSGSGRRFGKQCASSSAIHRAEPKGAS